MFEKILSNLPYNPNLIKDLGFYAKRVRHEESLRRLSLIFVVLAFFVQFFAYLSPPTSSLADSTNDMINGGFQNISELVADCNANVRHYHTIIGYYGLTCWDLSRGKNVTLKSTDYNHRLYSMGWNPQGSVNQVTGKPTDEQPVNIPGLSKPLYWRYLWSWDPGAYTIYNAVKVTSKTGQTFFILYVCGNIVHIGIPSPYVPPKPAPAPTPTPKPKPKPKPPKPCIYDKSIPATSGQCKPCEQSLSSQDTVACIRYNKTAADITQGLKNANGHTANAGDVIVYTLTAHNSGKATVKNFVMQDDLSYVLDYANIMTARRSHLNKYDVISWPAVNIGPGKTLIHHITVRVKNPIPQTPPSISDPEYFDHIMTNVYGTTINIYLPKTTVSVITTATTTTLPNTGPGSSIIFAAVVAVLAGYFFFRSKLLSTEASIAIQDNNGGSI